MKKLTKTLKEIQFKRALLERLDDALYINKGNQFYKNIVSYINNLNNQNWQEYIWLEREGSGRVPFYMTVGRALIVFLSCYACIACLRMVGSMHTNECTYAIVRKAQKCAALISELFPRLTASYVCESASHAGYM